MPAPEIPAATLPPVRDVPVDRPLLWLRLGWRDFMAVPLPSVLHGVLAVLGGFAIVLVAGNRPLLLAGAFSGFMLVAPVLVTGLYELSRLLARGRRPTLHDVFMAWRRGTRPLVAFGLVLMLVGSFWVGASALLVAVFVKLPVTDLESFLRHVVLAQDSYVFEVWTVLGGLLAALVFATTVVSAPLMLDREIGLRDAMLTSVRAVSANPLCMALWATIIMVATFLGMATMLIGLVLVLPVVGHASWHAYADTVDASGLPHRH